MCGDNITNLITSSGNELFVRLHAEGFPNLLGGSKSGYRIRVGFGKIYPYIDINII